jgi:hypothetical protein
MKNIHLIQTEKPTGLFESKSGVLHYSIMNKVRTGLLKGHHIYITSDEEIKEGDAVIHNFGMGYELENPCDSDNLKSNTRSKIILTTDPDLIKDGVQAIDDEFLEWFVKNQSCESVEVKKRYSEFTVEPFVGYKIIIPQEEPKQETLEEAAENFVNNTRYRNYKVLFIEGAKWQAERMYSEEEVLNIIADCDGSVTQAKKWLEQFKKK